MRQVQGSGSIRSPLAKLILHRIIMDDWRGMLEKMMARIEQIFENANHQFPYIEIWMLRLIDFLFSPREVIKHMIMVNVLQLVLMSADATSKFTNMVSTIFAYAIHLSILIDSFS